MVCDICGGDVSSDNIHEESWSPFFVCCAECGSAAEDVLDDDNAE